ncbi:hypothetical protein PTSG_04837 [Salpingoeca rosetta]|uniref:PIN domain-containing protein n=1 Tax=Salpingoeca rosetta (strain ATCC 50818 / BSB-021) TaxID=946362 RepID=F2U9U7_SALR5|nr:uncharacterized protein PTSG_04837 [Salpingoeca rosetta]EGD73124.1 hypothetical protein PTSG_04837 [Salpingoeca rosetta]|eukprot:XP_004994155.1 hypothetical protein PTSG_04837 [Salpingoeca rosetta]
MSAPTRRQQGRHHLRQDSTRYPQHVTSSTDTEAEHASVHHRQDGEEGWSTSEEDWAQQRSGRAASITATSHKSLDDFESESLHRPNTQDEEAAFKIPLVAVEQTRSVSMATLPKADPLPATMPTTMEKHVTTKNRRIMANVALTNARRAIKKVVADLAAAVKHRTMLRYFWRDHMYKVVAYYRRVAMGGLCFEYLNFLAEAERMVMFVYEHVYDRFEDDRDLADLPTITLADNKYPVQQKVPISLHTCTQGEARRLWIGAGRSVEVTNRLIIMADCLNLMGDMKRYQAQHVSTRDTNPLRRDLIHAAHTFYQASLRLNPTFYNAYNKLAVLAELQGRPFEVLYHHARSMAVKTPLQTAPDMFTQYAQQVIPRGVQLLHGPPRTNTPTSPSAPSSPRRQRTFDPVPLQPPPPSSSSSARAYASTSALAQRHHQHPNTTNSSNNNSSNSANNSHGAPERSPFHRSMWILPWESLSDACGRLVTLRRAQQEQQEHEREEKERLEAEKDTSASQSTSKKSSMIGLAGIFSLGSSSSSSLPARTSSDAPTTPSLQQQHRQRVQARAVHFAPSVHTSELSLLLDPKSARAALDDEYSWPRLVRASMQHFDDPDAISTHDLKVVFAGLMALIHEGIRMHDVPPFSVSVHAYLVLLLDRNEIDADTITACTLWIVIAVRLAQLQDRRANPNGNPARSARVAASLHLLCSWLRLLCAFFTVHYDEATATGVAFNAVLPSITVMLRTLRNNASILEQLEAYPMLPQQLALAHTMRMLCVLATTLRRRLRCQVASVFADELISAVDTAERSIARLARRHPNAKFTMFPIGQDSLFSSQAEPLQPHDTPALLAVSLIDQRPDTLRYLYVCISQMTATHAFDYHLRGVEHLKQFYRDHAPTLSLKPVRVPVVRAPSVFQLFVTIARAYVEFEALADTTRWVRRRTPRRRHDLDSDGGFDANVVWKVDEGAVERHAPPRPPIVVPAAVARQPSSLTSPLEPGTSVVSGSHTPALTGMTPTAGTHGATRDHSRASSSSSSSLPAAVSAPADIHAHRRTAATTATGGALRGAASAFSGATIGDGDGTGGGGGLAQAQHHTSKSMTQSTSSRASTGQATPASRKSTSSLASSLSSLLSLESSFGRQSAALRELKEKQRQLKAAEASKQAVLKAVEREKARADYEFVVMVSVVMPDTNCFLSQSKFDLLKKLFAEEELRVIVPTMVLCELESMKSDETAQTNRFAVRALQYLQDPQRASELPAATPDGRVVAMADLASGDWPARERAEDNDTVILTTVERVSASMEDTHTIEGERFTVKPIIFLTDDKNLQVRSRARHLPVISTRDMSALMGFSILEEQEQ